MKFAQYTNSSVAATAANLARPIGILTQKCMFDGCSYATITSGTSGANTISINEAGKYRITYVASLAASAAGNVAVSLNVNGNTAMTYSDTSAAIDDFVTVVIDYVIRVSDNCSSISNNLPANIQFVLGAVGVNSGISNLIIEKIG